METLLHDLRYAARSLAKTPGFTLIAILTLALGIGANTAIFSVLDSVLLRLLPVSHPEELATLTDPDSHGSSFGSESGERSLLAYSEFEYLRDHNDVFSRIFAADSALAPVPVILPNAAPASNQPEKESARVRLVSGDYFAALGIAPAAGRLFTPEVDRVRNGSPLAVISYAFWKRRFGLSPVVLGNSLQIHNTSFQIVGVAPPGFFGETVGDAPDIWLPLMMQDSIYPGRDPFSPSGVGGVNQYMWLQVMGRLKPGASIAQAKADINVSFQHMLESIVSTGFSPEDRKQALNQQINVQPGSRGPSTLQSDFGQPLKFLMALVGLILLIACANVANLLLARGAKRQKEFALRLAVGAGRTRIVRQLFTESLLLAALGAAAGVLMAYWADALLLNMVSGSSGPNAVHLNLQPDARVLAFTLGVTVFTAVLFGLVPALAVTRLDFSTMLKSPTSALDAHSPRHRLPLGKLLVVVQVSVSLVLLIAAGLFVHSLSKLTRVNVGYNRENLLLFAVNATAAGFKGPATTQLYEDVLQRLSAIPGVQGITASKDGLFSNSESGDPIAVEGYTPKSTDRLSSRFDHIGPNYFSIMGIPVLMGREIEARDSGNGPRAAVINQTFARQFFPDSNPIGKHVRDVYPGNPGEAVIVGVVSDAKYNSLREKTPPRIYLPLFNPMWEARAAFFEVRTFADPASVSAAIRQTVQAASPSLPPIQIHSMSGLIADSLQTDRFVEQLSEAFGLLAILLASIGLYGIMAYTVARRTRDIGIRLALGAEPGRILRQVLGETLTLVLLGIVIGVPLALAGTYLVRSMLFGLGLADPLAILFGIALLTIVAVMAGLLPARRAALVDPMIALRYE